MIMPAIMFRIDLQKVIKIIKIQLIIYMFNIDQLHSTMRILLKGQQLRWTSCKLATLIPPHRIIKLIVVIRKLTKLIMSDTKKYLLIAGGIAFIVGALFVKNVLEEKSLEILDKEQVIHVLKIIKKEKYTIYKQIATFAINIVQQTRNNNPEVIEQFISGPESPLKLQEEIDRITELACTQIGTTSGVYGYSLEKMSADPTIANMLEEAQKDYKISLTGKLPAYKVKTPENFTKQRFYQIQNQITKKIYLQQVALLKKLQQYSEHELQQNPALMKDIGNPDVEQENILREQGLGSEFEPALAVFEQIGLKFRNDPQFRNAITRLEQGYQKIIMRYAPKIQSKSLTDKDLSSLEDQITFFEVQLA